ncbi:uncharacterized protein LOC111406400, partial [Olea europaea subsp. europaea]
VYNIKNNKCQYMPFWEAIDEIWSEHLHNPLHSAGYYFNPFLFYSNDSYSDPAVSYGMGYCVFKMPKDHRDQNLIMEQVVEYSKYSGGRNTKKNALSWTKYQEKCPQLQQLAIRILSQTCDGASKFKLMLLTEGMNLIER